MIRRRSIDIGMDIILYYVPAEKSILRPILAKYVLIHIECLRSFAS
jgi:hypothetical protein